MLVCYGRNNNDTMESTKVFQRPRLVQTFSLLRASIGFLRVLTPSGAPVFSSTYFSPGGFAGSLFTLEDSAKKERDAFWRTRKTFYMRKKNSRHQWPESFPFLSISRRNNQTKNRWIIHQVFEHLFKSTSRLHNAFATAHRAFVASTEWVAWFRTVDLRKTINPKYTSFLGQTWNMS